MCAYNVLLDRFQMMEIPSALFVSQDRMLLTTVQPPALTAMQVFIPLRLEQFHPLLACLVFPGVILLLELEPASFVHQAHLIISQELQV